jgi:hypothetical protein
MKLLPLVTATSLALFLAPPVPAKQASRPVVPTPQSIAAAQTKFCQEWVAQQRSANKDVDRRAKLMAEARKPPRKSTLGAAFHESYPDGQATLSDHPNDQIVFISTFLEKGESATISKLPGTPSYNCPNTYTLFKSVSDAKGNVFMTESQVIYLP